MHLIDISESQVTESCRNSVGGTPWLSQVDDVPRCRDCNATMALFLQFDIASEFELPFQTGSHFLAFMCPEHNDTSSPDPDATQLKSEFWKKDLGHFAVMLLPPGESTSAAPVDRFIEGREVTFKRGTEEIERFEDYDYDVGSMEFKVGGVPGWLNYAMDASCACGGKMDFLCQIPCDQPFRKRPDAPEQPDSFSSDDYCFLLGNQVYILACNRQCHPLSLVAICDN